METLEKAGHVALFFGEAILIVVLFWACGSALRPDAVQVTNDTTRLVTLRNCAYTVGTTNSVDVQPGQTRTIHAVRACQVHSPGYVGCLSFADNEFESQAKVRVSAMRTYSSPDACSDTGARQQPIYDGPGRN